jgi:hypothetical protein
LEPTYTTPPTTAGDEPTGPPVEAVHSGVQVVGVPVHVVAPPAASNAYNFPSLEPTYTTPPTTAGDEPTGPPVAAVHTGGQIVGDPKQVPFNELGNA